MVLFAMVIMNEWISIYLDCFLYIHYTPSLLIGNRCGMIQIECQSKNSSISEEIDFHVLASNICVFLLAHVKITSGQGQGRVGR
mmetsp:Transcript_33171/g.43703  ORF Transcript_33171/g.43703 Transcript_33171/m.43703 type:complete len:84 (-) Transcript_33171:2098-2349(-)